MDATAKRSVYIYTREGLVAFSQVNRWFRSPVIARRFPPAITAVGLLTAAEVISLRSAVLLILPAEG